MNKEKLGDYKRSYWKKKSFSQSIDSLKTKLSQQSIIIMFLYFS